MKCPVFMKCHRVWLQLGGKRGCFSLWRSSSGHPQCYAESDEDGSWWIPVFTASSPHPPSSDFRGHPQNRTGSLHGFVHPLLVLISALHRREWMQQFQHKKSLTESCKLWRISVSLGRGLWPTFNRTSEFSCPWNGQRCSLCVSSLLGRLSPETVPPSSSSSCLLLEKHQTLPQGC